MVPRMYRLVFVSSCFLFYILQRWFRNVRKKYRIFPWCLQRNVTAATPSPPQNDHMTASPRHVNKARDCMQFFALYTACCHLLCGVLWTYGLNNIYPHLVWVIMRWRVQLGINSTSDVWRFCQNWTSRRGESNLANFQTSRVLLIPNCTSNIAWLLVYY
jgi:hypothetical protein